MTDEQTLTPSEFPDGDGALDADRTVYLIGLYPFEPGVDRSTLSLIRLDGEQLDVAPLARGPIAELKPIEERLWEVKAEGDVSRLLEAASLEATRAGALTPGTPLFAFEGEEMTVTQTESSRELTDHPDWPDASAWEPPPAPKLAAQMLPVTFGESQIPFDREERYVPHHRDHAGTIHFFSVVERPADSPLPETVSHELRYFRALPVDEGVVMHDSLPVMPVSDPATSPWPLPALHLHLENGDLDVAQSLARQVAHDNGLPFPHRLPPLESPEPAREPEAGWYHFDTALVSADPQGVDDGYSVGVVDVYANHQTEQVAARYLPMGEFDTLDEALSYQQQTLYNRIVEDHASTRATDGFNRSPAVYERIARAEVDAALTDLLEQHDGHYPSDYDGVHEPAWEALTSKEWDAYRDHLQAIAELAPDRRAIRRGLPGAAPGFADDALVAASEQPNAPYLQPADFQRRDITPGWRLDIVPARDPAGTPLGYSAVCVVDFSDLAEAMAPDWPERAQWLEVAQFRTEERAQTLRDDFLSLVESDPSGEITGPILAGVIADDLKMDSQWEIMDKPTLDQLKAGKWHIAHETKDWLPLEAAVERDEPDVSPDLDL